MRAIFSGCALGAGTGLLLARHSVIRCGAMPAKGGKGQQRPGAGKPDAQAVERRAPERRVGLPRAPRLCPCGHGARGGPRQPPGVLLHHPRGRRDGSGPAPRDGPGRRAPTFCRPREVQPQPSAAPGPGGAHPGAPLGTRGRSELITLILAGNESAGENSLRNVADLVPGLAGSDYGVSRASRGPMTRRRMPPSIFRKVNRWFMSMPASQMSAVPWMP
jgi:hypothetical protein